MTGWIILTVMVITRFIMLCGIGYMLYEEDEQGKDVMAEKPGFFLFMLFVAALFADIIVAIALLYFGGMMFLKASKKALIFLGMLTHQTIEILSPGD